MKAMRKARSVVGTLQDIVVAFGLKDEFEAGKFSCPITGERLNWDTLGRMRFDGENVTLFSIKARIGSKQLRVV